MNTLEQSSHGVAPEDASSHPEEEMQFTVPKISGFDGANRSIFKEPSLYLSMAIVFVVSSVCLNKTPAVFWISLISLLSAAIAFHVLAERILFKSKKEFEFFAAPFEGVFVLTFGSILPGLGLLAYGAYAVLTSHSNNIFFELGKLALLLAVPLFNFAVWSSVRRGYLIRPRLVGLMNGFGLGLSMSWSVIWMLQIVFHSSNPLCKFGWILLLSASPFMLFAAGILSFDLFQKTEPNIKRITTTFSILGGLLSFLFVFTPMARSFYVQSLISEAQQGHDEGRSKALLRYVATDEDLKPSTHPVSGFALAELLIPNRGLETNGISDQDLYFKITGKPFIDAEAASAAESETASANALVGGKISGLALAKSQITGSADTNTMSSSIDWTMTLHNSLYSDQEARCEIALPSKAAVSRVTLWIDGEPKEAAFAGKSKVQQAYENVVASKRDPVLVTMPEPDRILVQCFPVTAKNRDMRVRLGFKIPMETEDGKNCLLTLPRLIASNFAMPKRHRITINSKDRPIATEPGVEIKKADSGFSISSIIKGNEKSTIGSSLKFARTAGTKEFATPDWYLHDKQYIVSKLKEVTVPPIKNLFVLLDSSASLASEENQIKRALSSIPEKLNPQIFIVSSDDVSSSEHHRVGAAQEQLDKDTPTLTIECKNMKEANDIINSKLFEGGRDNSPSLRETLELAAEKPNNAVLWIHGPQPIATKGTESVLDLVHRVRLYDMQLIAGPNNTKRDIQLEDASGQITFETVAHKDTVKDVGALAESWNKGAKRITIQRFQSKDPGNAIIIDDKQISAQNTCLWAQEVVDKMMENGMEKQAQELASTYRLISPITGAVVLESNQEYKASQLNPGAYKDIVTRNVAVSNMYSKGPGLVGAPVDPRYGQSNEVGQLADIGYDTAKDIVRLLTALTWLVALLVGFSYARSRKKMTSNVMMKAAALVVAAPMVVHLLGTYLINNFGGLGGGL